MISRGSFCGPVGLPHAAWRPRAPALAPAYCCRRRTAAPPAASVYTVTTLGGADESAVASAAAEVQAWPPPGYEPPPPLPPSPRSGSMPDVMLYLGRLALADRQLVWRAAAAVALLLV